MRWMRPKILDRSNRLYCRIFGITSVAGAMGGTGECQVSQRCGILCSDEWENRPYREREVMEPWTKGHVLPDGIENGGN